MIKKITALLLALLMTIGLFAGCSKAPDTENNETEIPTVSDDADTDNSEATEPEESIGVDENINQTFTIFTVIEINDEFVIVAPMEEDPVWGGVESVRVPLEGKIDWEDRQIGDEINVAYLERIVDPAAAEVKSVLAITLVGHQSDDIVVEETEGETGEIKIELDDRCVYQSEGISIYLGNGYYGKDGSLCPTAHLINETNKTLKLRINNFAFDDGEKNAIEYYSPDIEPGKDYIWDLQHEFEAAAKSWSLDVDFETLKVVTFSLSVVDATGKSIDEIWGSEAIDTMDALTINWSHGQVWYF